MGIKERQERGREAVRSSILDAARELFVTDGFEQVSIRKIAERVDRSRDDVQLVPWWPWGVDSPERLAELLAAMQEER